MMKEQNGFRAMDKQRSEASRQFDEIWKEWNDPEIRAKKKLLENRQKRIENNQKDLGL
jgi:hypothetical protein